MNMKRGEIYLVDFSNQEGSEQGGIRPAVVIQNDIGNTFSPTTIVCPLTSQTKKMQATHVEISSEDGGLIKDSIVLCEQIRVIDKRRIKKKLGNITSRQIIDDINRKLMISMGIINVQ